MACPFTKAYLLTTIRALLNETTADKWTDEQIENWINEAAIDISTKSLAYEKTHSFATTQNVLEYDEPDECVKVHAVIRCSPADSMSWDGDDTIDPGGEADININGGIGPFTWEVDGTGFWFDEEYTLTEIETSELSAVLYADDTACGTATITVTDASGSISTGYVRCTEGQWVLKEKNNIDACGLRGIGDIISEADGNTMFELIEGNKKQNHIANTDGAGCRLGDSNQCCNHVAGCCNPGGSGCGGWECLSCIEIFEGHHPAIPYYNAASWSVARHTFLLEYYEWECWECWEC